MSNDTKANVLFFYNCKSFLAAVSSYSGFEVVTTGVQPAVILPVMFSRQILIRIMLPWLMDENMLTMNVTRKMSSNDMGPNT